MVFVALENSHIYCYKCLESSEHSLNQCIWFFDIKYKSFTLGNYCRINIYNEAASLSNVKHVYRLRRVFDRVTMIRGPIIQCIYNGTPLLSTALDFLDAIFIDRKSLERKLLTKETFILSLSSLVITVTILICD